MNWRIVGAGLAALAFMSCTAAQDDRNSYYWSNGERVAVVVAPSSVALRFSVEPTDELISMIGRTNGLLPSDSGLYSPLRGAREVVYSVAGATPISNRYLAELQDQLTRSGAPVADVARVLTTATGAVAAMPQQLSIGFVDGVSGLGDLRGLDVESSVSVVRTLNARPLVVSYRVNADSDRTALEIANEVFEYRDASGRRLVTYAVPTLRFPGELRAVPNQPRPPNDPKYPLQWHLSSATADVDAPEAWDYARGALSVPAAGGCVAAERIRIAVLDDGVKTEHPDLVDNISPDGKDYTSLPPGDDPNPSDDEDRHGTQAAGVIAACGHNELGVSGICPLCEILPIKIAPSNVDETLAALYDSASVFAADVISSSWGRPLTDDFRMALDVITGTNPPGPGIPVFFAVPNTPATSGCATDISGAEAVIAVSGSSAGDLAGGIASSGDCVDLVAPTAPSDAFMDMIITTDFTSAGPTYTSSANGFGGTSSATALAAGIGGLVLSLNPELTQQDVRDILQHTAEKIATLVGTYDVDGFSPMAGYGRVNAHRAVVPVVKIAASKTAVQVNEPFDITVSASAPHLLSSIGWSRALVPCPAGVEEWRPVDGKAFHEETWTSVTLPNPGVYVFRPNAKDSLWPASDGYPHIASDSFPSLPEVVIEVQGTGAPAPTGCVAPMPPTNLRVEE